VRPEHGEREAVGGKEFAGHGEHGPLTPRELMAWSAEGLATRRSGRVIKAAIGREVD
jgi:hypothetical protein